MVTVNADAIPEELKERDQWLMWDKSNDTPRQPHWRGNFRISWSNPDDWHSFEEAIEAAQERESWGIGYVMAGENDNHARGLYGCLDLDGCLEERGKPKDWLPSLEPFIDAGAYMEYSPSGDGIHIPIVGQDAPDWWSDSHFSDDEHEGVEYLQNKFCTFTGDALEPAGSDVTDIDPTPYLLKAYKEINGEMPRYDVDDESDDYGDDRELSKDEIADALGHLDPGMAHKEWVKVGYAVHDWDDGSTGQSVFESWSSGSSKYDRDAERTIEWIWSNASQDDGVSVGTLIHKARNNGWELPKAASKGNAGTAVSYDERTDVADSDDDSAGDRSDTSDRWEYVRTVYDEEGYRPGRQLAADELEGMTDWMYVMDSDIIWVYDEDTGYFNQWGEEIANRLLERNLGTFYSQAEAREIVARIKARNQTRREELNARTRDTPLLCVGNGVVNLETGELMDHSPKFKFTRGLKWDYDPARAEPDRILEFLDNITKREADRDTLLDHLAHGLMPGHPYRAMVVMYGPGGNGKTQFGKILSGFVGNDNAASVELQDLTGDDSFATGGLPGAFVNIGDDISVGEIRDTSIIKSVTGDGTVRANVKHEKKYDFENEAAMFFSANEPPRISEQTDAIDDRLYPIEMPYQFVHEPTGELEKQRVPAIADNIIGDDAAMRGLLLLAVKHAQELIDRNGRYSMPEGPAERREMYEAASDPIKRFGIDYLDESDSNAVILKDDAYTVYTEMCAVQGERAASSDVFKNQISKLASVDVETTRTRKMSPGDDRENGWRYVEFAEKAKEVMPSRLQERYSDGDSNAVADADATTEGKQVPYGAAPLTNAAETLTGYVTVTAEVVSVETYGEDSDNPTTKAILKDESGAMDLVTWDADVRGRLESLEGEHVALEDVEVRENPNNGKRELHPVDGLTEYQTIQQGVGYTKGPDPDDGQADLGTTAATDGGSKVETPDESREKPDAADVSTTKGQVHQHITTRYDSGDTVTVAAIAGEVDLSPDDAKTALDKLAQTGIVATDDDGYEVM